MSDLNTISDKLDQLLSIVKAAQPAPEHLAWMNPPITEAEAVIAKTRDAAMTNVSAIAADTAAAVVERLTGTGLTAAEAASVKGA